MNFLSKIFSLNSNKNFLSLDIGTEFVKAMVFSCDKNEEKVVIKGFGEKRHEESDIYGGIIFNADGVVESCAKAIAIAEEKAKVKPQKVIVSVGGEYIANITETKGFERKNFKTKISAVELEEMIRGAQKKITETSSKKLHAGDWKGKKLIGADIVDFSIDGYRVINPVNFSGKSIKIVISNSYIAKKQFDLVKYIISRLNLELSGVSYGPYAVLKAIGAQDIMNFNAVFMDIGGGTTEVVVIRNRNIEDAKLFVFGGKAFTKSIANKLVIDIFEAEKMKIKFSNGEMSGTAKERIEKIVKADCDVWLCGVKLCMDEMSKNVLLPSKIFLYGGASQLPQIKDSLVSMIKRENFPFLNKPDISFIKPSDIISVNDVTKNISPSQYITAMSLANLSLDLSNEEDLPNKIIKKISYEFH